MLELHKQAVSFEEQPYADERSYIKSRCTDVPRSDRDR